MARAERDIAIGIEISAMFVRFWLTSTSPPTETERALLRRLGNDRYDAFIEALGRRLAKGPRLREELREDIEERTDEPPSSLREYPQDALLAQVKAHEEAQRNAPIAAGLDAAALNFGWRIKGDKMSWRPLRIFDDGARVFIEFSPQITQFELPPLFVIGADKKAALVNYRVRGRYMIVDTLFDKAELRLGAGSNARRVQLLRTRPAPETRP